MEFLKFSLLAFLLLISFLSYSQPQWKILDNYEISFFGTKAEGTFRGLQGIIKFDAQDLKNSLFEVSIEVSTIATGNDLKNKHARGDSWLNAKRFPKIYFVSQSFEMIAENEFKVTGVLTLKGIKKSVDIPFQFQKESSGKAIFSGVMEVNREDFGIEGNLFAFMVGEEFQVDVVVPVESTPE